MFKPRQHQSVKSEQGTKSLLKYGWAYLAMEVRTGKTITSLMMCEKVGAKNVLFITKKKAISSIEGDMKMMGGEFNLFTINYESMHKAPSKDLDVIVLDESHKMGAFPKPSGVAVKVKKLIKDNPNAYIILLSGTPTPESFSQIYHQVYSIKGNPFEAYSNFYKFARDFVKIYERKINGYNKSFYDKCDPNIMDYLKPVMVTCTQKEAGFSSSVNEKFMYIDINPTVKNVIDKLKTSLVVEGKEEVILADTSVKLQSKMHQLYSGTIKFESGNRKVLDYSKAEKIRDEFKGKKIGVFYVFKAELDALKHIFNEDLTEDIATFDKGEHQVIALQVVSGREGISLKNADVLVFYNIAFSATSYWQARDRLTTKERASNDVYWLFTRDGIESKVYDAVSKKKDYTLKYFRQDFL